MNFSEIKELISILDNTKIAYLEMKNKDEYIKIDKSMFRDCVSNKIENEGSKVETVKINQNEKNLQNEEENAEIKEDKNETNKARVEEYIEFIKSPIVGTFYLKSSPNAEPFVQEGDKINKGDIVCIIEAMKLMNEINSEFDCEIIEVMAEEGNMVQYGDKLFKVKKSII